jgi:4-diphosphocytidyl-2-C-methyl-D-erythritol kinase
MVNKKQITLLAPAKINVCLGVTGKRADGYHDIDSVMQTVSLFDKVTVSMDEKACGQKISVFCPGFKELNGEKNIAYRVAKAFLDHIKAESYSVSIDIEKVIPMEAGLGGGSSDAASVLIALNMLAGAELSEEELCAIGAKIGADVPFLVRRGTALVEGIGEIITPCRDLPDTAVLIAYPKNEKVSTGKAYAAIDARGEFSSHADFEKMKEAIEKGDLADISRAGYNIFESVLPESSAVFKIKEAMLSHGALMSLMSGSGSAVFGFFPCKKCADRASEALTEEAKTFAVGLCRKGDSLTD